MSLINQEELQARLDFSSQYSALTKTQLADTTFELVRNLKQLLREQWENVYKEDKESSLKLYKQGLNRKAVVIRNEILSRINNEYQNTLKLSKYEEPTNIFGLAEVAFDLKNLARILLGEGHSKTDLKDQIKPLFFKNPKEAEAVYRNCAASEDDINKLLITIDYPKEKYDKLKVKYPLGFVLFSIDAQRNTLVSIPESSILRKDYYINWNMLKITSVTSPFKVVTN